jgi:hypothetical protein
MPTERDKVIKLLKELGIGFKLEGSYIMIDEYGPKVDAYAGFFAAFEFNIEGEFLRFSIGE